MKFKTGDKVVIARAGGYIWNDAMDSDIGKSAEIIKVSSGDETYLIAVYDNSNQWWVKDENIELARNHEVCRNCRHIMSGEACEECCHNYTSKFKPEPIDDGKRELQWILCSDRLPDKDGDYLITNKYKGEVMVMGYHGGWNRMSDGDARFEVDKDYVVAWMPLPEHYEY